MNVRNLKNWLLSASIVTLTFLAGICDSTNSDLANLLELAGAVLDCIVNCGAGDKVQLVSDSINPGLAVYVDYTLENVIVSDNNTLTEIIQYCASTYMGNNTFVTHYGDSSDLEGITLLGYIDEVTQSDLGAIQLVEAPYVGAF